MPGKMMDPAFLLKLSHRGIYGWKTSHSILPYFDHLLILLPLDLLHSLISDHFIKFVTVMAAKIKVLSEEDLTMERFGGLRVATVLFIDLLDPPVESSNAQCSKFEMGTERCCLWFECCRFCLWFSERNDFLGVLEVFIENFKSLSFTSNHVFARDEAVIGLKVRHLGRIFIKLKSHSIFFNLLNHGIYQFCRKGKVLSSKSFKRVTYFWNTVK
jgi:hypothetical protein